MPDFPSDLAAPIRLLLTDVDGVLTDGGVYYGAEGEMMKRFNIRDGMGVERLRAVGVEVGFITGETSPSVARRAEKLGVTLLMLGCKAKAATVAALMEEHGYAPHEIAYIGDDVNDLDAMMLVGLRCTPADGLPPIRAVSHYVCAMYAGNGAFREVAEGIIEAKEGGSMGGASR